MKIVIKGLSEVIDNFDRVESGLVLELRGALAASLRDIQKEARENHHFTSRSGKTEQEIKTERFDTDGKFGGRVYIEYPIGIYQHEGTGIYGPRKKAIWIEPRKKKLLRYLNAAGEFRSSKGLYVKGIKPDPFLYRAAENQESAIISRFDSVVSKILSRLT